MKTSTKLGLAQVVLCAVGVMLNVIWPNPQAIGWALLSLVLAMRLLIADER